MAADRDCRRGRRVCGRDVFSDLRFSDQRLPLAAAGIGIDRQGGLRRVDAEDGSGGNLPAGPRRRPVGRSAWHHRPGQFQFRRQRGGRRAADQAARQRRRGQAAHAGSHPRSGEDQFRPRQGAARPHADQPSPVRRHRGQSPIVRSASRRAAGDHRQEDAARALCRATRHTRGECRPVSSVPARRS